MESIAGQLFYFGSILDWRMMADVVLLAGLIFFLLRTFRLLGTAKIFYGLLAALLLFLTARLLGLKGTSWVFANFTHIALLGFIVIFQPEIRRLLERAGSYRRMPKSEIKGDVFSMQLTEIAFSIAEKRWGALIVLPGKESIQPWISEGVELNAAMSLQLILSLFDPHSPGHDGAIVVDKGLVSHFGVRLPLSKSGTLSNYYGTRHHAAMGLCEATDALVLLVSEERGSVSVFLGGKMMRMKDKNETVPVIRKHLEEVAAFGFPDHGTRRRYSVQATDIVLSILAAVFFCTTVIVSQAEMREKVFSVPVEYRTSEDVALGGQKVPEVKVHLRGPKSELDVLSSSDLSVRVDLKKTGVGRTNYILTRENMKLPPGVSLLDVEPASLNLSLRLIQEREAVVNPQLVGSLPKGLRLVSVRVVPERVKVLCPEGGPGTAEAQVSTSPIDLEGIHGDTTVVSRIIAPPSIQPVDKTWPDVEVEITVSRR